MEKKLSKLDDFFETNLKNFSAKRYAEDIEEINKNLEHKASMLELKKLKPLVSESHEKFSWLEER